jgi:hypothetical protein
MRRVDICLKCEKERPIVSNGFCRGCYQQAYRAAAKSNEAECLVKPDRSQRRYQEELSDQRIMLSKVVKSLERTHVAKAALGPERVAAIISELNIAIRKIDNMKQFSVNSKIEFSENSNNNQPKDAEEFSENSNSESSENLELPTESDEEFSGNQNSEFSVNTQREKP